MDRLSHHSSRFFISNFWKNDWIWRDDKVSCGSACDQIKKEGISVSCQLENPLPKDPLGIWILYPCFICIIWMGRMDVSLLQQEDAWCPQSWINKLRRCTLLWREREDDATGTETNLLCHIFRIHFKSIASPEVAAVENIAIKLKSPFLIKLVQSYNFVSVFLKFILCHFPATWS